MTGFVLTWKCKTRNCWLSTGLYQYFWLFKIKVTGVMHEADPACSTWSTWWRHQLAWCLTSTYIFHYFTVGSYCMLFIVFNGLAFQSTACPKKVWTSLEKNNSALKSNKSTNHTLLDRKNLNLDFDTSFVKMGWKLVELCPKSQSQISTMFENQTTWNFTYPMFSIIE